MLVVKLISKVSILTAVGAGLLAAGPATAGYREVVPNDLSKCNASGGPAVKVTVNGIRGASGKVRVQLYRANEAEWLSSGKWLHRIEVPARAGTMTFCMPVPAPGSYGIAVRHDVNNNGETDIRTDGGAMSNNPSINVFNLGKPSYKKTAFPVGQDVKSISVTMRYF